MHGAKEWSQVVKKGRAIQHNASAAGAGKMRSQAHGVQRGQAVQGGQGEQPCSLWPASDVRIITEPRWSREVNCKSFHRSRLPGVEIRKISDAAHPVCGAYGLFATRAFRVGDCVGEYVGDVVSAERASRGGNGYIAALGAQGEETMPGIDAARCGNETRFINDARGVGDGVPNCRLVRTTIRALPAVLIIVVRPVRYGDEFLLNYGQDYWG